MEGDIQCPVETRNVGQVGQAMHVLLARRQTEGSALRKRNGDANEAPNRAEAEQVVRTQAELFTSTRF